MRIGIAGPMALPILGEYLSPESAKINTYSFPYISQLAVAYLRAGHSVDLFTSSTEVDKLTIIDEGRVRLFIGRRRSSARARGLDLFRIEREDIRQAISQASPDVVHAHWTYEFASAALSVQPDCLVTAHDSPQTLVRYYHHPYWWLRAALGIATIRKARHITVVAPTLRKQVNRFTRSHVKAQVIPNGIDSASTGSALQDDTTARYLSRASSPIFCCIANGFDSRKNTRTAILAFSRLLAAIPGAKLLLYGNDHEFDGPAHRWADAQLLTTNVHFLGPVGHDDLMKVLHTEVDVLLHTSVWEACSLALLEAQARGVPVIGGERSGGVPYTLNYGESGVLTEISSPDKLAAVMVSLVTDRANYEKYSRAAIDNVRMRFDFADISARYLRELHSICNRRQTRKSTGNE